jgi:hypothetical protein
MNTKAAGGQGVDVLAYLMEMESPEGRATYAAVAKLIAAAKDLRSYYTPECSARPIARLDEALSACERAS